MQNIVVVGTVARPDACKDHGPSEMATLEAGPDTPSPVGRECRLGRHGVCLKIWSSQGQRLREIM